MRTSRTAGPCHGLSILIALLAALPVVLASGPASAGDPAGRLRLTGAAPALSAAGELEEHIGVGMTDGRMAPILRADRPCRPCQRTVSYTTAVDGQTSIPLVLLRGASVVPGAARPVAALEIRGLAPAPAGRAHVRLTLGAETGDLWVEAVDAESGAPLSVVRVDAPGGSDPAPASPARP
jgi:hypothetical protein